ncbi:MAG: hypothetical protein NWF00_05265 [Candidatus Bathyarchaeota archaeon]|nr:hypothetical protein [Candidatus Bathyarchaeota archaeon]
MSNDVKTALFLVGAFIGIVGLAIGFAMPYTVSSTTNYRNPVTGRYESVTTSATLYGHPAGYALAGVGSVMFIIGLIANSSSSSTPTERSFQGKVCGDCAFFSKEQCKLGVKLHNAMPCEDFTP